MVKIAELEEAVIIDSIPSDIEEENHRYEQPQKQRKPRSDSGQKRAARKPKDKYAILEQKLKQALGYPVMFGTLAAMQRQDAVLMADCQTLGKHADSLPKAIVDVAREHEWFYNLLNNIFGLSVKIGAVGALCVEVVLLALELASNHGIKIDIPGLSFES